MDTKKVFSWIGIFLIGVIVGALVLYLVCCRCNVCCEDSCKKECKEGNEGGKDSDLPTGIETISIDTAKAYFTCYMKSPRKIDTLVAFNVSMEQFLAMELLKNNDTTAKGFRIYMGVFGDPEPVNMVVATDMEGDDNTQTIYKTGYSDPCPDLCDEESDIVNSGK